MSKKRKLTLKQQRFVKEYIQDGNATKAVRESYPNVKTEGARRVMGSKLVTNGNVQATIQEVLDKAGLTAEFIVGELKGIIKDGENSEKNKALRTAAEIMGLIGRSSINQQINVHEQHPSSMTPPAWFTGKETQQELYAHLRRLLQEGA